MTAFFPPASNGPAVVFASTAVGNSVTFLPDLVFVNTTGNAVNITHSNHTLLNMTTLISGAANGVLVNAANDCKVVNTATGTIATLSGIFGFSAVLLFGDRNSLANAGEINATNGTGVTLNGDDMIVENSGRISGLFGGISAAGLDYTIRNSGTIEATGTPLAAGVVMGGAGTAKSLFNTGVIQSLSPVGGIAVQVSAHFGTAISNAGTILSAGGIAIDASTATGWLNLTNSGSIISSSAFTFSVAGTALADTIVNTGSINRSIDMGDGEDIYDGIGGFVGGAVHGGGGFDTYRVSDMLTQIFEDVGGGTDTIESLASYELTFVGEVENLTLLGTASDGIGNALANTILGNLADNRLGGLAGDDTINGGAGTDSLRGDSGNDSVLGEDGDDCLRGGSGADTLYGGDGDDEIWGDVAGDRLFGDAGEDVLVGGAGRDTLYGGADADTFVFRAVADSGAASFLRDIIVGFEAGLDQIDLTRMDANTIVNGNQAFVFLGTGAFTNVAGQLRAIHGGSSILQADVNGDGVADFELQLNAIYTVNVNDILL